MYKRRHSLFWWLLIGSSLCLLIGLLLWPSAPPTAEAFALAQKQWAAQQLPHYQLVITREELFGGTCKQTFEVQQEQVSAVLENTCTILQQPPASVTELFARIESYVTTWKCGPNGCSCGRLSMDVAYDPIRGYPQQATLRSLPPGWGDRVSALAQGGACTTVGVVPQHFEVLSLTALP
jgi:hypothetical protein